MKERAVNRDRALIANNQMAVVDGNESAKVEDLRRDGQNQPGRDSQQCGGACLCSSEVAGCFLSEPRK